MSGVFRNLPKPPYPRGSLPVIWLAVLGFLGPFGPLPWASFGAREAVAASPSPPAPARYVLLVCIDGLAFSELESAQVRVPNLRRLANKGVMAPLATVFPSLTWVAHASLVTGQPPAVHGVIGNRFFDRAKGRLVESWTPPQADLVRVPTLYDKARANGFTTAAVLWPGTSRARGLNWNLPEVYEQKNFEADASPGFLNELAAAGLPTSRLGRHGDEEAFLLDSFARDTALHVIEKHRPGLMLTHFVSVDTFAHAYGPGSPEARWGLELADRYLGDLLAGYERAGLGPQLNVVVVSDHGMLAIRKGFSPSDLFAKRLSARDRQALEVVYNGHVMMFYVTEPSQVRRLVPKIAELLRTQPDVERVVLPAGFAALGLPASGKSPYLPDLLAIAKPDVFPWQPASSNKTPQSKGMHGYLPTHPDLRGVFIASGAGVQGGARPTGLAVTDVAPIVAKLLGFAFVGMAPLRTDVVVMPRANAQPTPRPVLPVPARPAGSAR